MKRDTKPTTPSSAREALAHEEKRLGAAKSEVALLTRELQELDPDDGAAMRRVTAERDAARGKVEALEARVERARQALADVEAAAAACQRQERQAELVRLREEISAAEDAVTAEVIAFRARLADAGRAQRELVARLNTLERLLTPGNVPSAPSYWGPELAPGAEYWACNGHPTVSEAAARETVQARLAAAGL